MLSISQSQTQLAILKRLAELIENPQNLAPALDEALKLLAEGLGMMRGAITLVEPRSGKLRIEASYGLNEEQHKRGSYSRGEGITGRVIETGQPMCIVDVSENPHFLNRTGARDLARERISFICVPIKLGSQIVGALSVDQLRMPSAILEDELAFLRIIAILLAHTACESQETMLADSLDEERPKGFVGNSRAMRQVYAQIEIVAQSMTTVLLQGESGTGKELAAKAIHSASSRARGPFISLNCAALPENLIESELFGHERGAFTGATQTRKGRFELASGGTLFLDEIGELSPMMQAKFLRILQEKNFERLGGMETISTDARLITATNRNLAQMVEEGLFRRDLYYRLNVFSVALPPLRERLEDIPLLAVWFLRRFAQANDKKPPLISLGAMDMLQNYAWPGNIRELQNVMERASLFLGHEPLLLPEHLPEHMRLASASPVIRDTGNECKIRFSQNLQRDLNEVEQACIAEALASSRGNVKKAALMLGLTERILGLRMKKYGLSYKDFRKVSKA